jgi:ATP-dependent helicase/nuclease subunit A
MSEQHHAATPGDQAARDRMRQDLDRTLFVEAGAGTGKTTALVGRIVALVAADRLSLEHLVAITFTEAAAAELKERVRRELEKAAADGSRSPAERNRFRSAAAEVDLAAIQTIHAFAGSLLRTYPIEARLPPGFATWDDLQASFDFDERFRSWLYDEVVADSSPDGQERQDGLRRALLLGLTFEHLRALAEKLSEQTDFLAEVTWEASAALPDALAVANQIGPEVLGLRALVPLAKKGEDDRLVQLIRRVEAATEAMAAARDEDDALNALQSAGEIREHVGALRDWQSLPNGENPLRIIQQALGEARETVEATLAAHRQAALAKVLAYVRELVLTYECERRRAGVATFHDLLTWARDLLRDDADVRARIQTQYTHIFVDEFQDTDPLQAEIVWYLAADPVHLVSGGWQQAAIVPGKLFVVGDPKQSIYRFRRADIGLYSQIYGLADADQKPTLTQNFRSVPIVIDVINHHFSRDMAGDESVQARYVKLLSSAPADGHGGAYRVGGPIDGPAADVRSAEAEDIARAVRLAVIEERWKVRRTRDDSEDPGSDARQNRPVLEWLPARYRDVCVLLPSRTNLRQLEDAFERFGVPYRVEGGSLVLKTSEVRDLLSCLRAVDDPSDQVAVVAALRSPAYACSDVDLLEWVDTGGALDYTAEEDGRNASVGAAMCSLRAFHAARADRSTAATIDEFIRERMLAVQAFGHSRPRETWRRLRYVVAQARRVAAAGRPGLRALLDWLENLDADRFRDPESPLPEADEDAVRIMTIHAAKGLEFPIVVMSGLGAQRGGGNDSTSVIPDRGKRRIEARAASGATDGFAEASDREKRLDEAEQVRLDYVAATRARDHLILCLHHGKRGLPAAARLLKNLAADDAPPCRTLPVDKVAEPTPPAYVSPKHVETPDDYARCEREWLEARAVAIERGKRAAIVSASTLGSAMVLAEGSPPAPIANIEAVAPGDSSEPEIRLHFDDDDLLADDTDAEAALAGPPENPAAALGDVVHSALVAIDRGAATNPAAIEAARRGGIGDRFREAISLVEAARASPTYREALATPRHWHEVPVGVEIEGVLLQGRIDLLWERSDGTLGIIDVKTDQIDRVDALARAQAYRSQVGAYALAIQEVTRRKVSRVEILFASLGGMSVEFEDLAALVAESRRLVGQAR